VREAGRNLIDLFFVAIVLLVALLALSVFSLRLQSPNPILRVNSFPIAMRSWPS
jgi:hypothetical protein